MSTSSQSSLGTKPEFLQFAATYGKHYSSQIELEERAAIYMENDKLIAEWNMEGNGSFTLSHNKFSDWTPDEFSRLLRQKNQGDTPSGD